MAFIRSSSSSLLEAADPTIPCSRGTGHSVCNRLPLQAWNGAHDVHATGLKFADLGTEQQLAVRTLGAQARAAGSLPPQQTTALDRAHTREKPGK